MAKKKVTQNATHTPGPWTFEKGATNCHKANGVLGEIEGGDFYLAAIWSDVEDLEPHAEANARLIAAAPELLDALNGMVGLIQLIQAREPDLQKNHRFIEALAVIAKAEGR